MTVELPKDAEGRDIPLDTKVLFDNDGKELRVKHIEFYPFNDTWRFVVQKGSLDLGTFYYRPEQVCLENPITPDSWEKLEEDLQRIDIGESGWFCMYAGYDKDDESCHSECKFFKDKTPCDRQAARDIVSRIRKLRGEGDA